MTEKVPTRFGSICITKNSLLYQNMIDSSKLNHLLYSNLRSLPKRVNTWPKQNLMRMMSEVRNKTLNHVLYLVNLT